MFRSLYSGVLSPSCGAKAAEQRRGQNKRAVVQAPGPLGLNHTTVDYFEGSQ